MKKVILFVVVLIPIVSVAAFFLMKDNLIESRIQTGLEAITGLEVELGTVTVEDGGASIGIDLVTIRNVSGFNEPDLAHIADVQMSCDASSFLMGNAINCQKVSANINEIFIERSLDSKVNLAGLKALDADILSAAVDRTSRMTSGFLIERLEMTMHKLILFEQVKDQPRRKTELDLGGRKEVYGFLTNPYVLTYIPIMKSLGELGRGSLGLPRTEIQQKIIQTTGKI